MSKLLVVDDEQSICWGLTRVGESIGHDVVTASSAEQAIELADRERPDVVVLDVRLPGMDGLTAIKHLRKRIGSIPIIVITAYGDLETAVEAVRSGAFEYLLKPFDLDQVQRALVRAFESGRQADRDIPAGAHVSGLIGKAPAIQEVFKRLALAAAADACVLICGESGTGKELAARAIHKYSNRADGPFVAVNVASLGAFLTGSELFGHVRGAFTGAEQDRTGLLAQADGGTLFLDEVADIPMPTQVKLLRALEHGEVTPVGSNESVHTDFRVVSATHQDLLERVKEGSFRHDLYFRLCAFQIDIPPLRQRREDIRELVEHFLGLLADDGRALAATISPETLAELECRHWYGNVRELRNTIEHAVILARGGGIMPEHLPPPVAPAMVAAQGEAEDPEKKIAALLRQWAETRLRDPATARDLFDHLSALVEPPVLQVALEKSRGQCAAAARRLGLHRTTLRKKLDQYGIDGQ